jgi:uncharacterized protein YndB with AHSA1/START domain
MQNVIENKLTIKAPIQTVWKVLTHTQLWWEGMTLDPKLGGEFKEIWDDGEDEKVTSGKILVFDAPNTLQLSWKDEEWPDYTEVTFALKAISEEETELFFKHSGWKVFSPKYAESLMKQHRSGWDFHLEELQEVAETTL